ncbi:putative GMC oxidoreductase [Camillea tinctor]|nr:putative GMC oxidoreductase [Camillea tinctor]
MDSEAFDIIIVGGGTAGPVLANRLSEDKNLQVLLLEAGEDLTADPRVNNPSGAAGLLAVPSSTNWGFETTSQESLRGRKNIAPAGRLLGGSSTVNGFAFLPNSKASIDAWAGLGNPGWDWPSFSKSMGRFGLASTAGTENRSPLQLTIPEEDSQWPSTWRDTLSKLGFPVCTNVFSGELLGSLMGPETINLKKKRSSAGTAYLNDSTRSRDNLKIRTDALVEKIICDKSEITTATAVQYRNTRDGALKIVEARKEIIISAGALNSPRLLELSGIGNPELLRKLGINPIIDNPHVGENLQNHPMCTLAFEALDEEGFETLDQLFRKDPNAISAAQSAYQKGAGPLSKSNLNTLAQLPIQNTTDFTRILDDLIPKNQGETERSLMKESEAFVRSILSSPSEASGCYMTGPGFMCFDGDGSLMAPPLGTEKYFTIAIHLAHPLSRGSVHVTSPSAPSSSSGLSIDPKYFTHPLDLEVLARHVQLAETIATSEPLSSHLKHGGKRGPGMPEAGGFSDIDKAKDYLINWSKGAHHWTGSCAMAPRELGGVVDHELRVYGCRNLRVCDASIIPIAPRSNPQGVIYGVAEHGAHIIHSTL